VATSSGPRVGLCVNIHGLVLGCTENYSWDQTKLNSLRKRGKSSRDPCGDTEKYRYYEAIVGSKMVKVVVDTNRRASATVVRGRIRASYGEVMRLTSKGGLKGRR
jgi:hypothetical protein